VSAIHQQIRRTIRRHDLCPAGTRLVVALSGGSDSVAMTLLLQELADTSDFSIVSLAHFNHRLRPTAGRDEQFCRDFAGEVGLPLVVDCTDVGAYAAAERLSIEDAARRARYGFLHRVARDAGADGIAVGHTRDDQAETLLLKLIRGAGLTGLGSIFPRRGELIRPLLDVSRAELRTYLTGRRQSWVEDESNDSLTNPRNRIRHRVMPELDLAYSGAARALARSAAAGREDGQWLDELAGRRYEALAQEIGDGLELDASALRAEPPPIRRRILLRALRLLAQPREIGLEHVEMALEVLGEDCPGADLPGCRLELRRGKLVLTSRHAAQRDA
jgi:tRNA(Ile)-lysidine synthase